MFRTLKTVRLKLGILSDQVAPFFSHDFLAASGTYATPCITLSNPKTNYHFNFKLPA